MPTYRDDDPSFAPAPRRHRAETLARALSVLAANASIAVALTVGWRGEVAAAPRQTSGFTAWIYGTSLQWRAQPGQRIRGELRDGATVVARGATVANGVGDYSLGFQPVDPAREAVFRPGRMLVIQPEGGGAVTETVPALHIDVMLDRQQVEGSAPPGAMISLDGVREGRLQRIVEPFTNPEDGRISIPIDALDAERSGFVNATIPGGHTFSAPFVAFSADIEVGGRAIAGRASAGTVLEGVVEVAPSGPRHTIAPREVLAGRSWREDLPVSLALDAGAVITLTRTSAVLAAPQTMVLRVPTLRVAASTTEVYGEGPPDTEVLIELRAPGQEATSHRVRTDGTGQYRLPVDAEQPIGAGWWIQAALDAEPGVRYWVAVPFYSIEVGLYLRVVKGVVDVPGAVVRAVLKDANGVIRASGQTTALRQGNTAHSAGYFDFSFAEARIQPGDTIELDWRNGDPILMSVPSFTTRVNHETDVVSGEAPPGSRVELATYAEGGSQIGRLVNLTTLDVDATGRYAHSFRSTSRYDIQSRESGYAAIVTSQGYRFTSEWLPLVLAWSPSGGLSGPGLPGRAIHVELRSPSGERIALYDETMGDTALGWNANVRDSSGQSVHAQVGDHFDVTMGDATTSLVVPELFGIVHVGADLVTGRTLARTHVRITIANRDGGFYSGETTSNESGAFLHEFGELFDIRHNAVVTMRISLPGGHSASNHIDSPGAVADLDAGIVSGAHEPDVFVEGVVERGGVRVAGGTARAAINGDYLLDLFDDQATNLSLMANDVLRILAPTAEFSSELSLRVPEFSMAVNADERAVYGYATPGDWLSILPKPAFARAIKIGHDVTSSWADVVIDPDGQYRMTFPDATKGALRPGQMFVGRYVLSDGHIVRRTRVVPIANVQLGGDQVCGFGAPEDAVTVTLRNDRTTIATATGTVNGNGQFEFALRDPDGVPVQTVAGQRVDFAVGDKDISLQLPSVKVNTRWQAPWESQSVSRTVISGHAPPASEYHITHPTVDCFTAAAGSHPSTRLHGTTLTAGTFSQDMFVLPPGTTMQVALYAPNDHRYFARVDRPIVRAHVFSERIDGRAAPFAKLGFQLLGASGVAKGTAMAEADAAGVYRASFTRDGVAVSAEPGDTIELTPLVDAVREAGDVERIAVELLTFDFSASAGLIGRAPANRTVTVRLDMGDKGHRTFERDVDARGRFGYGPADLPPRADWTFADVTSVLLTLPTADGHEIVADGNVGFVPEPPASAFIPFAVRR